MDILARVVLHTVRASQGVGVASHKPTVTVVLRLNKQNHVVLEKREMQLCSAKCRENDTLTAQEHNQCLNKCQRPFDRLVGYITTESRNLLSRLERCAMDCIDAASDMKGSVNEQAMNLHLVNCVQNCAEKCIDGLPDWHQKLRSNINNNSY